MTPTPLSDHITTLLESENDDNFEAVVYAFLDSQVGVEAKGLPAGLKPGSRLEVGATETVGLPRVTVPDGRLMLRACADPDAFSRNFPEIQINALMAGRQLLELLPHDESLGGILLCSASSSHSVPINRQLAERLLSRRRKATTPASKPWWKFWSSRLLRS
ncbi:MAG: hypothetical protein AAFY88_15570 [Acidobacteriota bacterium]